MDRKEQLDKIVANIVDKNTKKNAIKTEYAEKSKTKALTTVERLDRIEKLLGIK